MTTMRFPHFMTRILLAALTLAVLALAAPHAAGAQVRDNDTAEIHFSVADGVSAADEAFVREGIALAEDYVRETLGGAIEEDLTVNVRDAEDPDDPYILAYASGNHLVVYTGSYAWQSLAPFLRIQTVVHEYVHIYQGDTLGDGDNASPMWLIEGMAEYLAFDAMVELGVVGEDAVEDYQSWAVLGSGYRIGPLEGIEAIWDFQSADGPVYPLSYLAVQRLAGDLPSDSLVEFLSAVDEGERWEEAFPDAFGIGLEEFYTEFDAWVLEELEPKRMPTAFREVFPEERAAPVTIVASTERTLPGDQALVVAETEHGSLCQFVLRDDEGQKLATQKTFADQSGVVFWLVTIPISAQTGRSEFMVDCGEKRDRVKMVIVGARDGTATSRNPD